MSRKFTIGVICCVGLVLQATAWANSLQLRETNLLNDDIRKAAESGWYKSAFFDNACTGRVTVADTLFAYRYAMSVLKTNMMNYEAMNTMGASLFLMRKHRSAMFVDPLKELMSWKNPRTALLRREAAKSLYFITRDKDFARVVFEGDDDYARAGMLEAMAIVEPESAEAWTSRLGGRLKYQATETGEVMNLIARMGWMRSQCSVATNKLETLVSLIDGALMHEPPLNEPPAEDAPPYLYLLGEFTREYDACPERVRQRLIEFGAVTPRNKQFADYLLMLLEHADSFDPFPCGAIPTYQGVLSDRKPNP